MGRLNKKTTIEDFNLTIEEAEQAFADFKAEDGRPVSFYIVRTLKKLADRLNIEVTHSIDLGEGE